MVSVTNATTQGAGSYHADTADSVRVEIPDTGVSLGELNRYLRIWLGHEIHVSGDLVRTGEGFALTVRYGAQPGFTIKDRTANLDALVERSAEQIYAVALPYRYVEYLVRQQRFAEAGALAPVLASGGDAKGRALANSAWARVYFFQGDMRHALEKGREAVRLDPDNPTTHAWLTIAELNLGHEEAGRASADAAVQTWQAHTAHFDSLGAESFPFIFTACRDEQTGDFAEANVAWARHFALRPMTNADGQSASADAASAHDLQTAYRIAAAMTAKDRLGRPDVETTLAYFSIAFLAGNWTEAVKQGRATNAILRTQPDEKWTALLLAPQLAYALAKTGDFRSADGLIAATPRDCDDCMRKRGRIAGLEGRWDEATQDFAIVAARSPHEPYAETDWGAMLLAKGDLDGAIAKFKLANQKGPHFADPLEMWGEALIAKNRSDLALAKFEEADKYAPNWGRLHLKWGEALLWSGDKASAQKQFAIARTLDLTPSEKSELAEVKTHV
jgi:tetratricopeptide (TPR) repeat protein